MAVNSTRHHPHVDDSGRSIDHTFVRSEPDLESVGARIRSFIETSVVEAGANGVVVPMSGGIDSTLTTMLAVDALGNDRVVGLGLPCTKMDRIHLAEAQTIADGLGIDYREVHLGPVLDAFETVSGETIGAEHDVTVTGNVIARLRMVAAYAAANAESLLVCGTANRSELLLGYFTKYGDGGADLFPLGDLYKTEVRALADHVGAPRRIIDKEPTAGLRAGQTDADDLGAPYDVLDPLLQRLVDRKQCVLDAANAEDVDLERAERVASMVSESQHKRAVPATPGLPPGACEQRPDGGSDRAGSAKPTERGGK
ncbi:NAD+ synthase [Halobacteria archaeon AArc-dxtr1]|nr:NAD+ synthase [Halobacteria archaeon AArc-dxtr1]